LAITNLDGVIAGMRPPEEFIKIGASMEGAGIFHSFFYTAGRPGAGVANSAGLGGAALTAVSGQMPWVNPGAGNSYLARFDCASSQAGSLFLCDRLWHNSGISSTTTTAQTINSVAWPARDRDGSTNGEGVMIGIEVSTATTNGAAVTTITMSYTNQAGTSGRTATIPSFPATSVAGTFVPFLLAAGDTGVRSIQSLTLGTTLTAGTIHLVAKRLLSKINIPLANTGSSVDALSGGFIRLYDNTVPYFVWLANGTGLATITGQLIVTQG
jgi:hypothetical protein